MPIITGPEPLTSDTVIRPAEPGEEDTMLDLLAEAAAWLAGRGIQQWPRRFPTESVRRPIEAGEALLITRNDKPIATCVVAEADPVFWGINPESAYYLGRLAVAREAAGIGRLIVDWVGERAAEAGKSFIRLATASDNPTLRGFYERAGFEHVADPPAAKWPTSLYQKKAKQDGRS
ncbi:GNAT family N-acetyltransferase [Amycolatopsis pittospori]|uniref:GNAT family N-acetyltransferase n=1 Tax=Amycolatopsis pittospori TaxID=2749434 RepID=UPI0015F10AAE|nr:GNAT family N-acetyltransferase [Amycolatopsis pittospori]